MKKAIQILFVSVLLLFITSCSNDDDDNNNEVKLLKRLIEVNQDGSSSTTNFIYNGNQIVSIVSETKSETFIYTGDLITKIIETDKKTGSTTTMEFIYSAVKLTKIISSDNSVLNYVYNEDQTVSYEKTVKNAQNKDVVVFHGVLFFAKNNLVKDQKILDDAGVGIIASNTTNIVYDDKMNALNNIKGYSKLLNYAGLISKNNVVIRTEDSTIKEIANNQIISSIKRYDNKNEYNIQGYPIEITSETLYLGGNDPKHLKSQLFYN